MKCKVVTKAVLNSLPLWGRQAASEVTNYGSSTKAKAYKEYREDKQEETERFVISLYEET